MALPRDRSDRWPPLVMDFTAAWAGPLAGAVLADFGWDVVKVESATRPDITRRLGPWADGEPGVERSGYFDSLNRGKRSIGLDLRNPEARELAFQLCLAADAVVENFAPGVMDRLGLGYERLAAQRPSIVMLSISGYGATGPDRDSVAYGQTIEAIAGLDSVTGYPGAAPMACGAPLPDHVAGMTGAFAVMQAMDHQRRTGEGAYLDVSMVESVLAMMPLHLFAYQQTGVLPEARGNADEFIAPHGCYRCAGDDRWVALSAETAEQWNALCRVLGLDDLATDSSLRAVEARLARRGELDEAITARTAGFEPGELVALLREAGVPSTLVAAGAELEHDETLSQRGFAATVQTTEVGPRVIAGRQAVTSFLREPLTFGGPRLGAHTDEVLQDLLGVDRAAIADLRARGVLS